VCLPGRVPVQAVFEQSLRGLGEPRAPRSRVRRLEFSVWPIQLDALDHHSRMLSIAIARFRPTGRLCSRRNYSGARKRSLQSLSLRTSRKMNSGGPYSLDRFHSCKGRAHRRQSGFARLRPGGGDPGGPARPGKTVSGRRSGCVVGLSLAAPGDWPPDPEILRHWAWDGKLVEMSSYTPYRSSLGKDSEPIRGGDNWPCTIAPRLLRQAPHQFVIPTASTISMVWWRWTTLRTPSCNASVTARLL